MGKKRFQELCSSCHGKWADGTKQGPPLVHKYYEPSHHGDRAFYRAIQSGTKQHHWSFGDMQPVPEATEKDATQIIQFLRWLQVQNGIR
jgi:cytochrome c